MAKNYFHSNELKPKEGEFQLKLVHEFFTPVEEEPVEPVEEDASPDEIAEALEDIV